MAGRLPRDDAYFRLKAEIEAFLYDEAELLDERRFEDWLELLADDLVYFMPLRRNVQLGAHAAALEHTREGRDIHWLEDDKWTLGKRIEQIRTGVHWAEEPVSRVCRLVGNVQVTDAAPSAAQAREVAVKSRFLLYQNRQEYETYLFAGKRLDRLRRVDAGGWQLARREIVLDQNVLLAKNLTVFF